MPRTVVVQTGGYDLYVVLKYVCIYSRYWICLFVWLESKVYFVYDVFTNVCKLQMQMMCKWYSDDNEICCA